MIHPVIPFGIKGVIWYQGESNVEEPELYSKLFPAMIKNWRDDWKQGDFPFYYVQIASYGKYMKKKAGMPDLSVPTDSNWARLREAQLKTLSLANTGMAVTIDIGDVANIHPKNKTDVGKRLALWALAKDYGCNIVYSGPLYKKYKIENDKIRIYFEHAGSGLITKDKELKGFAVAGADKKFVWAKAEIQGDTVLVWADEIKKPTAVRYGWADWSNCNLYNKEGLPASTFRSDNW
jgi:sialate O-acetylesterase